MKNHDIQKKVTNSGLIVKVKKIIFACMVYIIGGHLWL